MPRKNRLDSYRTVKEFGLEYFGKKGFTIGDFEKYTESSRRHAERKIKFWKELGFIEQTRKRNKEKLYKFLFSFEVTSKLIEEIEEAEKKLTPKVLKNWKKHSPHLLSQLKKRIISVDS